MARLLPPHQSLFQHFADANFASLSSRPLCQSFGFDTISICSSHISIALLFFKDISLIHTRQAVWEELQGVWTENSKYKCVCVTTSRLAYAHAYACEKENTHEDQRLILSVTGCACSGRRLQCLSRTWGFFSWITKEEQPIEGGPAAFSLRRINPAYSQTHSQNAVIFIADLNSRKNLPSSRWFSFFFLFFCFFHRDL